MTMARITEWDDPFTKIESQYGLVSWAKWLALEQERLNAAGIAAQIVKRGGDFFIALERDLPDVLRTERRNA